MALKIRKATAHDYARMDELFEEARQFMISYGNTTQWVDGFPNAKVMKPAVENGTAYVCVDDTDESYALGIFVLADFEEVYDKLEGGTWAYDEPYVVIHRLACTKGKGVGQFIFKYVMDNHPYIRLDTHKDNKPMLHLMDKLGFVYRGEVFYSRKGGGYRVAYDYHR